MIGIIRYIQAHRRKLLLACMDAVVILFSLNLASQLRFEWSVPSEQMALITRFWYAFLLLYIGTFTLSGMYSVLWRYASTREVVYFGIATAIVGFSTCLLNHFLTLGFSRAVLLNTSLFIILFSGSARLLSHGIRARLARMRAPKPAQEGSNASHRTVLIIGAGEAATYLIEQSRRAPKSIGTPVALLDDAPDKQKLAIQGIPVVGKIADAPEVIERMHISDIVIAMPSVRGERMTEIIALCNATHCHVRMLTDPQRVYGGTGNGQEQLLSIREPNIADFLARDEVHLDDREISAYLNGKVVLVTGGGGSIGSELCRQVMAFSPRKLVIFDIYENCAYDLLCELRSQYGMDCPVEVVIGSIRDRERLDDVMRQYHPNVVFHAAAHKHVPLMEGSPAEAVKNNVFGTLYLLESAHRNGVERFVQLSTDKAVNPTNVMGATKRVTGMLISYYAAMSPMKCMAVRFGNVLGSHGSVIPLFERQIKAGGPVTITDPDITRYFMTIPEAAQLVLQTGSMAMAGSIFVLDMGKPVRIVDLASQLMRYYGFEPGVTMQIKVIGLRPGEKLYEELMMRSEQESLQKTAHNKISIVSANAVTKAELDAMLATLTAALDKGNAAVIDALRLVVPTFRDAEERQPA